MADMTDTTTTPTDKAGEPVAWRWKDCGIDFVVQADQPHPYYAEPLYTHPHPSLSVGLDREAVARMIADHIAGGFDAALQDKQEWKDRHGLGYDCEPLDVNGPFKDDYLDAADAILALAAPAEGWQGIETAPKDGTYFLALMVGVHPETGRPFVPSVVHWDNKAGEWTEDDVWDADESGSYLPTHWMPLPAAPTGETGA